ncbi:MAG: squalene/phytoene synthase family protein [Chloroflexota bacterium]
MTQLTELQSADAYCRHMAKRHYENFSVASFILPPDLRKHLARIYAFCRTTDDLGDESGGAGFSRLEQWRFQTTASFEHPAGIVHPVLLALRETIGTFEIPRQPFLDLIDANIQDQTVSAYATWDELLDYCRLSAAPVGRMVLAVFQSVDAHRTALADDVCIGLQIANFAQDVCVDRGKGRTYMVQSDIEVSGMEGAIRAACDRSWQLLQSGHELEGLFRGRKRLQLRLYRLGGEAIIEAVRAIKYRSDQKRPQLSASLKARLVVEAMSPGRGYDRAATRRFA